MLHYRRMRGDMTMVFKIETGIIVGTVACIFIYRFARYLVFACSVDVFVRMFDYFCESIDCLHNFKIISTKKLRMLAYLENQ